jgi:hypothetical protein
MVRSAVLARVPHVARDARGAFCLMDIPMGSDLYEKDVGSPIHRPNTRNVKGRVLLDHFAIERGKILRGHTGKVLRSNPTMYAHDHSHYELLVEGPRPFSNLASRKIELLAGLKMFGLSMRSRELDFYMYRFATTAGISSMLTCLAYIGIIKARIPEPLKEGVHWQVVVFYICAALAMVLSLFNLVVTSFYLVQGQGLALHGAPGAIARAVGVFAEEWPGMRAVLLASLLSIALAGISLSWMKLEVFGHIGCMEAGEAVCWLHRYWLPLVVSIIVTLTVLAMFYKLHELQLQMGIADNDLVRGDWQVSRETRDSLRSRRSVLLPARRSAACRGSCPTGHGPAQLPRTVAGTDNPSAPVRQGVRRHGAAGGFRFRATRRPPAREHGAARAIADALRLDQLRQTNDNVGRAIVNTLRLDGLRQLVGTHEHNVRLNVVNAFPRFDRLGHLARDRAHNDGRAIARALRLDRLKQLVRARQQERQLVRTRQQERRQNNDDFQPLYSQNEAFQPVYG